MIYDSLKHVDNYKGLGEVYNALKFLAQTDFSSYELGRYELNENVYFMVQEYMTSKKSVSEVHEKYIDIQLLVKGKEIIGVAPIECEKQLVEAKPEKDVWKYSCKTQPVVLSENEFMVLYPNDIHLPGAMAEKPTLCRKVVVKIKF